MKQLHRTDTGKHILEATTIELANLLTVRQALDALCDGFEFTILAPEGKAEGADVDRVPAPRGPTAPSLTPETAGQTSGKRSSGPHPGAKPVRECARRTASGASQPTCKICGKAFKGNIRARICPDKACQQEVKRQYQAAWLAKRKKIKDRPMIAPDRPVVTAPETDQDKARRLAAIRAADARARLKVGGIRAPAAVFGSDSGIRDASDEDIAAVRGQGGEE